MLHTFRRQHRVLFVTSPLPASSSLHRAATASVEFAPLRIHPLRPASSSLHRAFLRWCRVRSTMHPHPASSALHRIHLIPPPASSSLHRAPPTAGVEFAPSCIPPLVSSSLHHAPPSGVECAPPDPPITLRRRRVRSTVHPLSWDYILFNLSCPPSHPVLNWVLLFHAAPTASCAWGPSAACRVFVFYFHSLFILLDLTTEHETEGSSIHA